LDITGQLAAVKSTNPVWLEAYRIFNNLKTTEYVHTTFVGEVKGIYRFDCIGFVDYVLQNGTPKAFKAADHGYERSEMVVYGVTSKNSALNQMPKAGPGCFVLLT